MNKEIKKLEKQNRFINFISIKKNITFEEARKYWCTAPYQELKELLKEFEGEE